MESVNLLLKNVTLICKGHPHHLQTTDIAISNGIITGIGNTPDANNFKTIDIPGLHVSKGWIDTFAMAGEPGSEQKETIASLQHAAASGGFTHVVLMPATQPPVCSKSQIKYILETSAGHITTVLPAGCISAEHSGKDLAEMYDMSLAGAVAFTDYKTPVNSGVLSRALQYNKTLQKPILVFADEPAVYGGNGQVNEGDASTLTGLKAIPSVAEEIAVDTYLKIAEYNCAALHIAGISSKGSVELLSKKNIENVHITAGVFWMNLCFTEKEMITFDANYKVFPPLRSNMDRLALIDGIKKGIITTIATDHTPCDIEEKDLEFDHASFGVRGLQGLFPALRTFAPELSVEDIIECLTTGPEKALNFHREPIKVGAHADLTLFLPDTESQFDKNSISYGYPNTPLLNYKNFIGKVAGIIAGNQHSLA
jgi:dihydroorotase